MEFQEAEKILKPLADDHSDVPGYQHTLADEYVTLGDLVSEQSTPEDALDWYLRAIRTLELGERVYDEAAMRVPDGNGDRPGVKIPQVLNEAGWKVLSPASHGMAAEKGNANPGVLPLHARAFGTTFGELARDWWIWAYSAPCRSESDRGRGWEFRSRRARGRDLVPGGELR